jgi:1-acyl-sn-glycerol-3-phosphate acyltransferase
MGSFYEALSAVTRPALRRALRWTIEGVEHIPEEGAVLLAANHISHLDALCLAYAADLRGRRTRFLAKAALFDVPMLGSILRAVGDIPAGKSRRSSGSALDAAVEALRAGLCLGIFPEGRISKDLEPLPARTVVARLGQSAGAPVVPVGLWGTHRIWAKGRVPRPRPGVAEVVAVGRPIRVGSGDDPHEATDRIMRAICAQVSGARELYPQRPPAGKAAWWLLEPDTARLQTCRNLTDDGEFWARRGGARGRR